MPVQSRPALKQLPQPIRRSFQSEESYNKYHITGGPVPSVFYFIKNAPAKQETSAQLIAEQRVKDEKIENDCNY